MGTRFHPIHRRNRVHRRNGSVTSRSEPPRAPRRSNGFVHIERQLRRTSLLYLRVHRASTTCLGARQNDGVLTCCSEPLLHALGGRPRAAARRAAASHACPGCAQQGCLAIGALLCRLMAAPRHPRRWLAQPSPRRPHGSRAHRRADRWISARRRRAQIRRESCAKVYADGGAA